MKLYLGTHIPSWLNRPLGVPLLVSHRRLAGRRSLPRAVNSWALDSGGFTELDLHGRWQTDEKDYVRSVRRYADEIGNLAWATPQDWMFTRPSDSCRDSSVIMMRLIMIWTEWVLDADELSQGKWVLSFYEFDRVWEPVDDLVPGVGDVLAWARRNGAREGTPFFVDPSGRADVLVNAFWRAPGVRGLKEETQRRYAYSLKVWLDFLAAVDVRWDQATRDLLAMFKQWRLSIEDNVRPVSPNTFYVDRAAIRRFYLWAAEQAGVTNPVVLRVTGESFSRPARTVVEGTPSAIRRADVKWLTPEAFRLWRNLGLRGFTAAGLPADDWRGRTEDRDVAFAEGLFGTGLRLGEWSSRLTVELPAVTAQGLVRGWMASACAKGSVGRPFWMRRRVAQQVLFYVEEGGRPAAIARAQRAGRYEQIPDRWLLRSVRADGVLQVVDDAGRTREVRADAMGPKLRRRLFREGTGGLEPVWLWLNHDGTPRPKKSWYKTFDRANARVDRALGQDGRLGRLWCRPHMLRHSMALRWYCIATFVAWQRTELLTKQEQRDFRNQLGDVWFLLATLLGHRSAETTREVYLEPFKALEVEQLVALMDADDRAALERLMNVLAAQESRVLTGEPA
jgi:integrase